MKPIEPMQPMDKMPSIDKWWPKTLGEPASAGSQDGMRYAFFPEKQLLLIEEDGKVKTFDSGRHRIRSASLRGGSQGTRKARSLSFTSEHGPVRVENLKRLT